MSSLPVLEQEQYVDREDQVGLLRRAINYIRLSGPVFQTIYEWTGIPGIGKTVLVELLRDLCVEIGVPYAHIDFDPDHNPTASRYATEPVLLIKGLFAQLGRQKAVELEQAVAYYQQLPSGDTYQRDMALDEVVRAFRRYVHQLLEKDPVVFLFDSTDQASPIVLVWLEEYIVSLLSQNGRCLFVFVGRTPLHWRRFEVRRRVRTDKLMAFEPRLVRQQFEKDRKHPKLIVLSERVHRMTNGHPMGNAVVLRRLGELADAGKEINEETFSTYEPELLDDLVHEVINGYVFQGVREELANACRAVALLRQFDVILLRRVLSEHVPDFKEYPRDAYGGLLGLLHTTHLVEWNDARKGYEIDPTLRRILGRHTRERNPKLYVQINQAALEVYRDWIERVEDNRSVYIIEELYHQACLGRTINSRADLRIKLAEQLRAHLNNHYTQGDPELLASALERLDKGLERDEELWQDDVIGGGGVAYLREIIAAHKKQVEQRANITKAG